MDLNSKKNFENLKAFLIWSAKSLKEACMRECKRSQHQNTDSKLTQL